MRRIKACRTSNPKATRSLQAPLVASMLIALLAGRGEAQIDSSIGEGRRIFTRNWVAGEPLAPRGDGLGPVFNAQSCAECHRQGGVGGGGPIENNALQLSTRRGESLSQFTFRNRLSRIHPGFTAGLPAGQMNSATPLHRFGVGADYTTFLQGISQRFTLVPDGGEFGPNAVALQPIAASRDERGVMLFVSQRNTPALFGLGLLDAVPDVLLHAIAAEQPWRHAGVSGRVAPAPTGAGRFGWRGQRAHLTEFVLDACAVELGLQAPGRRQGIDPRDPTHEPRGLDIDLAQVASLTAFIAALPRPRAEMPTRVDAALHVEDGERLFGETGCAACHLPTLGAIEEVYTDLLLHDLGPSLADPVAATPITVAVVQEFVRFREFKSNDVAKLNSTFSPPRPQRSFQQSSSGGYGGQRIGGAPSASVTVGAPSGSFSGGVVGRAVSQVPLPTNTECEYRTPPLWGARDSAPYLHDGRADSFVEAVAYHAGEAAWSRNQFFALSLSQRSALLAFLETLAAPPE